MTASAYEPEYVGLVQGPNDEWNQVVIDADREYVEHCLRWKRYDGLPRKVERRLLPSAPSATPVPTTEETA